MWRLRCVHIFVGLFHNAVEVWGDCAGDCDLGVDYRNTEERCLTSLGVPSGWSYI